MKSFKQFDESHTVALNSAEDDNLHLANMSIVSCVSILKSAIIYSLVLM